MPDKQRKRPQQERSWKKYHRMLDAAADLFDKHGIDPVTTNHIAEAAGVSIGSLYQFFPNKDAVIEALIERYQEAIGDIFPANLDISQPIEHVIQQVLSDFMAFRQGQSGFQTVMIGVEGTSHSHLNTAMQQEIINGIATVLQAYYPQLTDAQLQLCATISFSITIGMMPVTTIPHEILLEQIVMAVRAYQKAFITTVTS